MNTPAASCGGYQGITVELNGRVVEARCPDIHRANDEYGRRSSHPASIVTGSCGGIYPQRL